METTPRIHIGDGHSHDSLDDVEKGLYDKTVELTTPPPFVYLSQQTTVSNKSLLSPTNSFLSPFSPVPHGITPVSSVPELSLSLPGGRRASEAVDANALQTSVKKPTPAKPKISRWILFDLWFNTYRKFFTFIILLNTTGVILTALGRFRYAENHMGALVLGNLLAAIMFRNELWMRFLYMLAIYGLRSVRSSSICMAEPLLTHD
jgi:hypothetical protein